MASPTPKCSVFSIIITILFFLSSISISFSETTCNPSDKNTLLEIKSHFNNASVFTTWDPNTDCCTTTTWSGITCDSHGRVTMMALSIGDDIIGEIPASIGNLSSLQYLTFAVFPHLSGTIPPSIAKLNLSHLDFSLNNLTGQIPNFIGQYMSLDALDLSGNNFFGPIPSSLGRLTNLRFVNLGSNKLSGPIPTSLGQLKSLEQIFLYNNNLSGPLPSTLASLPNLDELVIRQNKLTGTIPPSLGSFKIPSLFFNIDLSLNSLSGPIPSVVGNANITSLDLSNNKFTGDASFLFGRAKTKLYSINLSNNQFKFDFSKVALTPGLKELDISHNRIYGSLPRELGQLPLIRLDVSFNKLCGQIPTGRRLKQFNAVKFSNNKCLCGVPLPACK